MILGIDAHCIRGGGGTTTHLQEVLEVANPAASGFRNVILWSGRATLDRIAEKPWLTKVHDPTLDQGLVRRSYWSATKVSRLAREAGCDVLWLPGCSFAGSFRPYVAMSRNMLPFEWSELRRFGVSPRLLKFLVLRVAQARTYRRSNGMIYLTEYARTRVGAVVGPRGGSSTIIPHGINARFAPSPTVGIAAAPDAPSRPFKLLYVSAVDLYKHQWRVVEAVCQLQLRGFPVELILIGPSFAKAERKLRDAMEGLVLNAGSVRYLGALGHAELPRYYQDADVFVYASSCENLPNILLEAMASGKPIACSSRGPMPEVLKDGGLYFDPEDASDIATAIQRFIESASLRREKAELALRYAKEYSWVRCADDTFRYLATIAEYPAPR